MKPKGLSEHDEGLLEYLEDIIGTYQYKELITLIDSELGELEEKRKDQVAILLQFQKCFHKFFLALP